MAVKIECGANSRSAGFFNSSANTSRQERLNNAEPALLEAAKGLGFEIERTAEADNTPRTTI